jgi:hypothetical protein
VTTLSARFVRRPQKRYTCDWCERPIDGPYIRLYGHPGYGPMSTLRLHPAEPCCGKSTRDEKIAAALAKASEP